MKTKAFMKKIYVIALALCTNLFTTLAATVEEEPIENAQNYPVIPYDPNLLTVQLHKEHAVDHLAPIAKNPKKQAPNNESPFFKIYPTVYLVCGDSRSNGVILTLSGLNARPAPAPSAQPQPAPLLSLDEQLLTTTRLEIDPYTENQTYEALVAKVQSLLEQKASVHAQDKNSNTPLHHAIQPHWEYTLSPQERESMPLCKRLFERTHTERCCHEMITFLILNGADPNKANKQGETPLSIIQRHYDYKGRLYASGFSQESSFFPYRAAGGTIDHALKKAAHLANLKQHLPLQQATLLVLEYENRKPHQY